MMLKKYFMSVSLLSILFPGLSFGESERGFMIAGNYVDYLGSGYGLALKYQYHPFRVSIMKSQTDHELGEVIEYVNAGLDFSFLGSASPYDLYASFFYVEADDISTVRTSALDVVFNKIVVKAEKKPALGLGFSYRFAKKSSIFTLAEVKKSIVSDIEPLYSIGIGYRFF